MVRSNDHYPLVFWLGRPECVQRPSLCSVTRLLCYETFTPSFTPVFTPVFSPPKTQLQNPFFSLKSDPALSGFSMAVSRLPQPGMGKELATKKGAIREYFGR
jgi:hypothetical protein